VLVAKNTMKLQDKTTDLEEQRESIFYMRCHVHNKSFSDVSLPQNDSRMNLLEERGDDTIYAKIKQSNLDFSVMLSSI